MSGVKYTGLMHGEAEALQIQISRLQRELDKAVEEYGLRHTKIDFIMAKLDPLIARYMKLKVYS